MTNSTNMLWRNIKRTLLTIITVMLVTATTKAQAVDTIASHSLSLDAFTHSAIGEAAIVSAPLFVGSLAIKGIDRKFADRLGGHFPAKPKHEYYLQYAPAAALLGMKISGVEGESTWAEMLTADAIAVACMGGAVELLKHTSDVNRPDGSDNHSYPSGHTATAFMTATMLCHEYGSRYPWVAVMGYGTATATGMMRIMQNRHNLSDVMAGASIGIMATEIGYAISDLIFKKPMFSDVDTYGRELRPSFIGYSVDINVPVGSYAINDGMRLKTSAGSSLTLEGAWYMTHRFGIGAMASYNRYRIYIDEQPIVEPLQYYNFDAGAYYTCPLSTRFSITTKMLAGYGRYARTDACLPDDARSIGIKPCGGLDLRCGLVFGMRMWHNLTYSLGCTYANTPKVTDSGARLSTLAVTISISVNL